MKHYKDVYSAIEPKAIESDEYSIYVNKNIQAVDIEGKKHYKYDVTHYTKDEYILMLSEQLTDTQLALVELYERSINNE